MKRTLMIIALTAVCCGCGEKQVAESSSPISEKLKVLNLLALDLDRRVGEVSKEDPSLAQQVAELRRHVYGEDEEGEGQYNKTEGSRRHATITFNESEPRHLHVRKQAAYREVAINNTEFVPIQNGTKTCWYPSELEKWSNMITQNEQAIAANKEQISKNTSDIQTLRTDHDALAKQFQDFKNAYNEAQKSPDTPEVNVEVETEQ